MTTYSDTVTEATEAGDIPSPTQLKKEVAVKGSSEVIVITGAVSTEIEIKTSVDE